MTLISRFPVVAMIAFLAACSRSSHHSDDSAPPPAPAPAPVVVNLNDAPLLVTANFQQWQLNGVGVDAGKPDKIVQSFTFAPQDQQFLSYGYEEKSAHDCGSSGDFDSFMEIHDAGSGALVDSMVLDGCNALPGGKTYRLTVTLTNRNSCASLHLTFGILQKSNCNKP